MNLKKYIIALFFLVIALITLGNIMVLSASSSYSALKYSDEYRLFYSHLIKSIIAIIAMAIFAVVPYNSYKNISKPLIFATVILLVVTLVIAPERKGAGRWISLGFVTFQPAELAKIILMIYLAALIERKKTQGLFDHFKRGFMVPYLWIVIIAGLILVQPNFSNAFLILFVGFILLFISGAKFKYLVSSSVPLVIGGLILTLFYPHARARVLNFIATKFGEAQSEPNIQVYQAKIGLGSGGFFGRGLGRNLQSNLFLPEAYGDFIFSIIGEELGFIGAFLIITAYFAIFILGWLIAKNAGSEYGKLLALGLTLMITTTAFVNIGVVIGLLPTTGIPLPFISFGGTAIVFMSISVGIIINIAFMEIKNSQLNQSIFEDENERKI